MPPRNYHTLQNKNNQYWKWRTRDIFVCGDGEDAITDFNAAEGDI
jgi:hypothetical protein